MTTKNKKSTKLKDTTLLIQGLYHPNTLKMIEKYKDVFPRIVVSTWDYEKIDKLKEELRKKIYIHKDYYDDPFSCGNTFYGNTSLIVRPLPDITNIYNQVNCYYQIASTLNGFREVKTKYTLKIRSDEYFSNLEKVVDQFDGHRMLCSNVFMPPIGKKYNYHISDHFFIAETDLLKITFQGLEAYHRNNLDYYCILNNTFPIEARIGLFFLSKKGGFNIDELMKKRFNCARAYKIMKKYFDVFDIAELKPYIVKWGHNPTGKTEIGDIREVTQQSTGKYISCIEDTEPSLRDKFNTWWR